MVSPWNNHGRSSRPVLSPLQRPNCPAPIKNLEFFVFCCFNTEMASCMAIILGRRPLADVTIFKKVMSALMFKIQRGSRDARSSRRNLQDEPNFRLRHSETLVLPRLFLAGVVLHLRHQRICYKAAAGNELSCYPIERPANNMGFFNL